MVTLMNIFVPLRPDYVASSHFLPLYDASTYEWLAGIRSSYLITTEQRISAGFCCCSAASRVSRIGNTEYKLGDALLSDDETPAWQSSASWRGSSRGAEGSVLALTPIVHSSSLLGPESQLKSQRAGPKSPSDKQAGRRPLAIGNFLFCIIHEHCHMEKRRAHSGARDCDWWEGENFLGKLRKIRFSNEHLERMFSQNFCAGTILL